MDTNGSVYAQFKGSNSSKFAPFPRDVIIDKEGKILYYSKAYHPKAMINVISDYLNITSASDNKKGIITDFALYQNYPNPFNPSTRIVYGVPKKSILSIKLFDFLGRELLTLIEEEKGPGLYEVEFNASSLSSGIYFYVLQSGSTSLMKKMILIK